MLYRVEECHLHTATYGGDRCPDSGTHMQAMLHGHRGTTGVSWCYQLQQVQLQPC